MKINYVIGCAFMALSLLLTGIYLIKKFTTKDLKELYELINTYEIKIIRIAAFSGIIGIEFLIVLTRGFSIAPETISRFFVAFGSSAICMVSLHYFLKVYYPQIVEQRLKLLRYTPRISPKTGSAMVLLRESEEDAYLDSAMINDEDVHSVDYDVWIDEKTGHIQIEKYYGYKHAYSCPTCGYQTLYISKEVIVKDPLPKEPGLLVKHFKCNYCNYRFHKETSLLQSVTLDASMAHS
jgi:hypothetical protein